MTLLLDSGALIAYERSDRYVEGLIERARRDDILVRTTSGVVAQVWRGGARQARIARLLASVDEAALTAKRSPRIGVLLGLADASDVVDASVVELARDGDEILTSDPADLSHLAEASRRSLVITPV